MEAKEHRAVIDCYIGFINTGFNARNLTYGNLLEEIDRLGDAMILKNFRRYRYCPICGREIHWIPSLVEKLQEMES